MHIQNFSKSSWLVIFKPSSYDSSPPLKLAVGGSSKVHKMSYTHPNLIPSVSMSSMRQDEEMGKKSFWYFRVDRLWPFKFQPEIFKFKYLSFCSSDWKTEDSSVNLLAERIPSEKPIFIFWMFTPKILVTLQLPLGQCFFPGTRRNFWDMGFHFFT